MQKAFWSSLFQGCSKWDRLRSLVVWPILVYHRLTLPKSRAERSTSSKVELKLSPTPLSLSEVTEAEGKFHQDKMETSTCRR